MQSKQEEVEIEYDDDIGGENSSTTKQKFMGKYYFSFT